MTEFGENTCYMLLIPGRGENRFGMRIYGVYATYARACEERAKFDWRKTAIKEVFGPDYQLAQ